MSKLTEENEKKEAKTATKANAKKGTKTATKANAKKGTKASTKANTKKEAKVAAKPAEKKEAKVAAKPAEKKEAKVAAKPAAKKGAKTETKAAVKKTTKKTTKTTAKKTTKAAKTVKTSKNENKKESEKKPKVEKEKKEKTPKAKKEDNKKSVQNGVIENIKSFISKIIQMQEKVKKDEEEEKELRKLEKEQDKKTERPKYLLEYYDLPFRYNETVVKILAQTPKRLFVYWDVSDKDKQTYLNAFGERFFEDTYPVLLVHNDDKNYTREVVINDFANSWYLDILDPRDEYTIQLGRKFKEYAKPQFISETEETNIELKNDYLFIAQSNKLEMPNDHILFEEFKPHVKYRNVKTKQEEIKNVTNTIYKNELKELYKKLYKDNDEFNFDDERYDFLNPSSMGTSSNVTFK